MWTGALVSSRPKCFTSCQRGFIHQYHRSVHLDVWKTESNCCRYFLFIFLYFMHFGFQGNQGWFIQRIKLFSLFSNIKSTSGIIKVTSKANIRFLEITFFIYSVKYRHRCISIRSELIHFKLKFNILKRFKDIFFSKRKKLKLYWLLLFRYVYKVFNNSLFPCLLV